MVRVVWLDDTPQMKEADGELRLLFSSAPELWHILLILHIFLSKYYMHGIEIGSNCSSVARYFPIS